MKKRIPLVLLLPGLALFGVTSCNNSSTPVVSEDSVFSLSLASGASSLYVGESDKVVVSCLGSYTYTYSSSDPYVVTVDGSGALTPVAVGSATLTVTQVETGNAKTLDLSVTEV